MFRRLSVLVAVVVSGALSPPSAYAQAWVPARGEGTVSFLVQDLFVKHHLTATGHIQDRGEIHSNNLLTDISYGVTDRLAVTLALPFIRTKYTGTNPHPSEIDNGTPHQAFQDLRFGIRYNLVDGALAITPFVGSVVPTHGYEYFAHAAIGPRVRELEVGTYVGRLMSVGSRDAFVQMRYSFGFPEEIAGVSRHRSNLDLEAGYFVSEKLRVFVLGNGLKTHGGIDQPDRGWRGLPEPFQAHHDRISRIETFDVGGGLQVTLNDSLEVFGSFVKTVAGENAHALSRGLTMGISWSFGRGVPPLVAAVSRDSDPQKVLVRCLCQKK